MILPRRQLVFCMLLLLLSVVSGLTTTLCALASDRAAHHCCEDTADESAAESSEGGCHCLSCTPSERAVGSIAPNPSEMRHAFSAQDFAPPRSFRSVAIDYPPEPI